MRTHGKDPSEMDEATVSGPFSKEGETVYLLSIGTEAQTLPKLSTMAGTTIQCHRLRWWPLSFKTTC